jgi:hypothetical protein
VLDQAGPGEGIVLVLGDQVPGKDGQFACCRDDGLLKAATSGYPGVERSQRTWRTRRGPRALDQHPTHVSTPGLGDPAVHRCIVAGLTDPRVRDMTPIPPTAFTLMRHALGGWGWAAVKVAEGPP